MSTRIYSTHADGSPAVHDHPERTNELVIRGGYWNGVVFVGAFDARAILAGLASALGCVAMPREVWERVATVLDAVLARTHATDVALRDDLRKLGLLPAADAPLPSATCKRCGKPWPCATRARCGT